jgi:tRNA-Thr(GGU) m(6)t(6)A37 methyltransferase TsaA
MRVIAHARNDYTDKFAVRRQSGRVQEVITRIEFTPDYRNPEALRGIDGFSHLWLLWVFHRSLREDWSPTVRPPRLGGNRRMGVFATRSPFRPNPIGLSAVALRGVEGTDLLVAGADLADGTPILDIKPYLPYADAIPEAASGFIAPLADRRLRVVCDPELLRGLEEPRRQALLAVLSRDPRPAYQHDPERVYGFRFAGLELRFTVGEGVLRVTEAEPVKEK